MPTLLALLFGVITFKRHIYGVYCAVITLAESLILQDFIIEYQAYTGGFNGITDYSNYADARFLWFILAVTVVFFVAARALTHSRVGTVLKSIRDNDVRAEFMGYNVANYRTAPCRRPAGGSASRFPSACRRCLSSRRHPRTDVPAR